MKKYCIIFIALFSPIAPGGEFDCENAHSTVEINQCAAVELKLAKNQMDRYLTKSLEHNSYDPELVNAIQHAQDEWVKYMTAHCDSVYSMWREGTIRGVMTITCKTMLTEQRTRLLWSNFLTYMDSTPPVLPEPK